MALCEEEEVEDRGTWLDKTDPLISCAFFWADRSLLIILSMEDDRFFSNFICESHNQNQITNMTWHNMTDCLALRPVSVSVSGIHLTLTGIHLTLTETRTNVTNKNCNCCPIQKSRTWTRSQSLPYEKDVNPLFILII